MYSRNILMAPCCDTGANAASQISRLLVMDDCPDWGEFVSTVAEEVGLEPTAVTGYRQFVDAYQANPADILVLDLFMPERDGIEIILDIAKLDTRPFIILMSGESSNFLEMASKLGQAKGLDIIGTLGKPFRLGDLRELLQKAVRLVDRQEKRIGKTSDSSPAHTLAGEPSRTTLDARLVPSKEFRMKRKTAEVAKADRAVKQDIKDINTRFCLALWNTQLAALDTLCTIPGAMIEAINNLATSPTESHETDRWKTALDLHLQTLTDSRRIIRESAEVHRLPALGHSAADSINRIGVLANGLVNAKTGENLPVNGMLANHRALIDEVGKLEQALRALIASLKEAITCASGETHLREKRASSRSETHEKKSTIADFSKPE